LLLSGRRFYFLSVMKGLIEFDSDNSLAVVDLKSLLNFQHDVELPHEYICLWKKDGSKKQKNMDAPSFAYMVNVLLR